MKCPACAGSLTEINVGGLAVDVCQTSCGGIWFDNFELQKVDESDEMDLEPLLDVRRDLARALTVDFKARRECPRCKEEVVLTRQGYAGNTRVQVDACPNCGGVWLDEGELALIRVTSTEVDKKEAANAYFKRLLQDELKRLRQR